MGGLPNQGPSKFIIIWIYLVAFAIIISFHILLYLFTSFHISVHWQVDVPKTQILLGSKGSSGFVSFPDSFFSWPDLSMFSFHMLSTLTVFCIAAVQVRHNQHPCPGDRQPRSFRHHGLVLQVLSDSLLLITKFLILVPFCPFIITFASQRKRWPCLRKRLGLLGLHWFSGGICSSFGIFQPAHVSRFESKHGWISRLFHSFNILGEIYIHCCCSHIMSVKFGRF